MVNFVSRYKERCIKHSIQRPFKSPLPPETSEYPYDKPSPHFGIISLLYAQFTEFWTFFTVYLRFNAPNIFRKLRTHWGINEQEYRKSFEEIDMLSGPMGFSGASFFITHNKKYLIKSLNRSFEYSYYYNHLLIPLSQYQLSHPGTYIVHITDCLFNFSPRLGRVLGTSVSNFLVMENVQSEGDGWENYDLKPSNYFFPERDFMGGVLATEETKEKLYDEFDDTIPFTKEVYERLVGQLDEDSRFLCEMDIVDYSLFMIRWKHKLGRSMRGLIDAIGEWKYKFCILDIFTSARMARTKAMKVGVKALGHGDMTITTNPDRYKEDWMGMPRENLRAAAQGEGERQSGQMLR